MPPTTKPPRLLAGALMTLSATGFAVYAFTYDGPSPTIALAALVATSAAATCMNITNARRARARRTRRNEKEV